MRTPLLRALVLRTRPYSETSLWVRLLTESHGKITGIAKGARRGTERVYSPLIEVEARGYPPRTDGHALWNLARPELINDWRDLARDPVRLAYAWSILEVSEKTLQEMEPHPPLYAQAAAALDTLHGSAEISPDGVLIWFLIRVADELGYSLQYELCPRCEKPLVFPVGPLVPQAGGFVCTGCTPPGHAPVEKSLWESFLSLALSPAPPAHESKIESRDLLLARLLDYLSYHVDRPLRLESLKLLAEPTGGPAMPGPPDSRP